MACGLSFIRVRSGSALSGYRSRRARDRAEIGAAAGVPFVFPDRARGAVLLVPHRCARLGRSRIQNHRWQNRNNARHAGAWSDLIRHVFECARAEIAPALKLAAIENHLSEARIMRFRIDRPHPVAVNIFIPGRSRSLIVNCRCWNELQYRLALRGCHPCLRYALLPMSPGWTR